MTREERIFLIVLLVNLAVSVIYLVYGMVFSATLRARKRKGEDEVLHDNRRTYLLRFLVMVFCPVIGPLFFAAAQFLYVTVFRFGVNLDDVTFKKDRVDTQVKADEEQERNIIPVEEALIINDKKSLRTAMMSIIRGETEGSLASIAMALDSDDPETAHYAASLLSDKLNGFRMNVRKLYSEIHENPEQTGCEEKLITYMNEFLKQQIFTELEQNGFVRMMAEIAENLYEKDRLRLSAENYEGVCLRLLELEEFEEAEKWCRRLAEQYPEELCAYTCRLKLYFMIRNRTAFFQTLDTLKKTDVVIDNETLEMIRMFS